MAANRTRASNLQMYSQPFGGEWMLVATMAQLPKGRLYVGLEVAGSGPVSCCFSFPSLSYHV